MSIASTPLWTRSFPGLSGVGDPAGLAVLNEGHEMTVSAGTVVFRPGSDCTSYLLVTAGSVRVQQTAPNGREIVLYRVQSGDSCILTTACLLGHVRYCAEGIAETDVRAVAIPVARFNEGIERSPGFRSFVFASFGRRLADLMHLVEEVAFVRIDTRLAQRLLELAGNGDEIELTHQELAVELGTAREVVSRALKDFERRGLVRLARGHVEIADREGLAAR